MQETAPRFIYIECVSASKIDRDSGRRFDLEKPWRCDDACVESTARELQPMFVRVSTEQSYSRARIDFDLSKRTHQDHRARQRISLEPFASSQPR